MLPDMAPVIARLGVVEFSDFVHETLAPAPPGRSEELQVAPVMTLTHVTVEG